MVNNRIIQIEDEVDKYLYNKLDENIPRYKYIYHMNLVYIDYVIKNQLWFSQAEKHLLFSLNYNTFLAYKKLKEEDVCDFSIDPSLYLVCFKHLILGMEYSMLCDVFPAIRSNKAKFNINEKLKKIKVELEKFPRGKYEFISKYTMKKSLSYTLQMIAGMLDNDHIEEVVWKLTKGYLSFWNENMMYGDFEPYSREDWGGVMLFFITASMRRFVRLYREDFNIEKVGSHKVMVVLSPTGKGELVGYTLSKDQKMVDEVLNDLTYKPIGNGLFPKSSISDSPIIQTKDGYLFLNPLVLLSNDSCETMLLNNLRKTDKVRYLRIKDKLKERVIPLIECLIKLKYPNSIVIKNFNLPIPKKKNQKRELDILIIDDESGFVLYIEVKHFFIPISFSEIKSLDAQLQAALTKAPDQLYAIQENWELIKQRYGVKSEIKSIKAIILSYNYLGKDVEINADVPIVDITNFYESLAQSNTIEELYYSNKLIDYIYTEIPIISKKICFEFAGYEFDLDFEIIDPIYEIEFLKSYRKTVFSNIDLDERTVFKSIEEHAQALLNKIQKNNKKE
jgi:hypothetical protein